MKLTIYIPIEQIMRRAIPSIRLQGLRKVQIFDHEPSKDIADFRYAVDGPSSPTDEEAVCSTLLIFAALKSRPSSQ
jgi:hypothetical protein